MLSRTEQAALEKLHNNVKHTEALFDGQPCWEWQKSRQVSGYGQTSMEGQFWYTHRLMYTLAVGPIPEGLEIDHLCRNRACCNPAHLEPVTSGENTARGDRQKIQRAQTHCKHGHEFTPENTKRHKLSGGRYCRVCINAGSKARKARCRAKAKEAKSQPVT